MNREDFICSIGYQGGIALVDGQGKKKYSRLSLEELIVKKYFNQAFRFAVFNGSVEDMQKVAQAYRRESGDDGITVESLKRLFGVYESPEENIKVKVV